MTLRTVFGLDVQQRRYTASIGIALTSVALIVLAQNYYRYSGSEAYSVGLSLAYNLIVYASFALFITPILNISAFFEKHLRNRIYWLGAHLLVSIGLVMLHMLLCNLILYTVGLSSSVIFPRFLAKYLTNIVQVHLLVYWAIVIIREFNKTPEQKQVAVSATNEQWSRFQVRHKGRELFLSFDDVYWIEALDHYQKLHTKEGYYLIKSSMKKLEAVLPESVFQRAHRSYFVNMGKVHCLLRNPEGQRGIFVELRDGTELRLGDAYASRFKSA